MPEEQRSVAPARVAAFAQEWLRLWQSLPRRWPVLILLGTWFALFQLWGNSTLGYVNTSSLFHWWFWVYTRAAQREDGSIEVLKLFDADEAYAWFIPLVVVALLWCRRAELVALPKRVCWPALGIVLCALLLHVMGYMIQQTRLCVAAFALGIYGLTGLLWGGPWLRETLFPFSLLAFCVPVGSAGDVITFPLRLFATRITTWLCHVLLGIHVVQNGTQLFDSGGAYQYEVAAACSGIRSLTANLAFGLIFGYLSFQSTWRRVVAVLAGFPLAIAANVLRLTVIILSAEAFGQKAGNYVHESFAFSLAPYVLAVGGMLLLGRWLREDRKPREQKDIMLISGAEQRP